MSMIFNAKKVATSRSVAIAIAAVLLTESFVSARMVMAQQPPPSPGPFAPLGQAPTPPAGPPAAQRQATPPQPLPGQPAVRPGTAGPQVAPGQPGTAPQPGQTPPGAAQPQAPGAGVGGQAAAIQAAPVQQPPSQIEATFQSSLVGEAGRQVQIKQFGYDVFQIPVTTFAPVEDVPVGPDYMLGPGDAVTVYVWGLVENVFTETVNRNGEIFIPRVGTLKVWGISFDKAEQLIRDQLSRVFTGFRTSVTLGRLRTIRVFVVGEVSLPGAYTLSALSTLTNALFAAGGPTKQGTLRRIRLLRNNHLVTELDFYDFLLRGDKSRDVRLESGDTVFVPPIGPVVGLVGNVNRPAIYEMKEETLVTDLLAMAGGVSPGGYLRRLQLERFRDNTDRLVQDINLLDFYQRGLREANPALRDGDLLRVFPVDPRIYNVVTLEGFTKRPGNYELRAGMRVGDLLTRDELLPEAYLDRAEVIRVKEDLSPQVIPFSIREVWAGQAAANLELRPLDRVVVSSEFRPGASVLVTGQVKRPGRYAIVRGERLSSLLERAGGFLPEAFPKGAVFTRESIRQIERQQMEKFIRAQEQSLLAESAALTAGSVELTTGEKAEVASAQTTITAQRRELLRSLVAAATLGRLAIRVDSPEKLKGTPDDILLEDGDTLLIPQQPTSVLVLGAVRNSTSILHGESENIEYYIARAGGPTREADLDQVYILKADGSALASFVKLRKIEPGDTIVVPVSTEPKIRTIPLLKDLATIAGGFAIPFGVIVGLYR